MNTALTLQAHFCSISINHGSVGVDTDSVNNDVIRLVVDVTPSIVYGNNRSGLDAHADIGARRVTVGVAEVEAAVGSPAFHAGLNVVNGEGCGVLTFNRAERELSLKSVKAVVAAVGCGETPLDAVIVVRTRDEHRIFTDEVALIGGVLCDDGGIGKRSSAEGANHREDEDEGDYLFHGFVLLFFSCLRTHDSTWFVTECAHTKAAVLTEAAGVTLKDVQSIDYSWGEIDFEVRPMNRTLMADECMAPMAASTGSYDMDIEPDDIEVSDTVTVLWEIG